MARYGKKKQISTNLNDYFVIVLGEPGIGKTSLLAKTCVNEFGENGYMFLEMSKELGDDTQEGIVSESVPDWKTFGEIVTDIIKNKETDYPDLKVIVIDTIDQWFEIASKRAIEIWNADNMGSKDFKPAKSLNAAQGGFGHGDDYTTGMMLDTMWALKKVGVQVWLIGHTKSRDIVDPVTNFTYTSLTTDMPQRSFNEFKNKSHVCAVAYIDRNIQKEKTGRQDIKKRDITIDRISSEARKISFRDTENYAVDSKSRFENIVDEVPLDAKAFADAIKDAIKYQKTHGIGSPVKETVTEFKKEEVEDRAYNNDSYSELFTPVKEKTYPDNLKDAVAKAFTSCEDKAIKKKVMTYVKDLGVKVNDMNDEQLKHVYDILTIE